MNGRGLLHRHLVWDNHACMPLRPGDRTFLPQLDAVRDIEMDVMARAEKPVNFSHSNPLALHKHKRNITDEAIQACAATGGVVCLNGIGLDYCYDNDEVNDYVHAHPELFPPEDGYADGINMLSPLELPAVVEELDRLGYGEVDLAKILGGNLLRVAGEVWK